MFADELNEETLQRLRDIGCDSAKAVLELSKEELMRRAVLDEQLAEHILSVIRAEFADEEEEEEFEA